MRVLILGAGGHAKVVADILQLKGHEVLGFLDDDPSTWNTRLFGMPVMGKIENCRDYQFDGLILGIGSNRIREKVVQSLGDWATPYWINAIHPTATLANSARIGHGNVVVTHAVVNVDAVIGNHVIINTSATVDHDCTVKDYAHVAPGANLAGATEVGEGAFVGIGAKTIPQCVIGDWAVVGAGATVVRNIPPNVIAKGTPARWE